MSNGYIPKERLTAYERWELAAFDEAERMAQAMQEAEALAAPAVEPPAADSVEELPPAEPMISPEELAAIRQQAFDEGRTAGFAEGLASGRVEGYANGEAQIRSEVETIAALAKEFSQALQTSESLVAEDLLNLAIDIAGQVLRTSLKVKPELMLPAVRDAIAALSNPHGHPVLLLNPEDAALIRDQLGEQLLHTGWRLVEDHKIGRGGCRIENSGAEIDATLPTRWRRVIEALGKQSEWLAGE